MIAPPKSTAITGFWTCSAGICSAFDKGLTGSPSRDKELEEQLTVLLVSRGNTRYEG